MTARPPFALLALLLLAPACSGSPGRQEGETTLVARAKSIFRTVHLEGSDVVLGQPLLHKANLGELFGDTAVRLSSARFAGATEIWIHLGPGDTVRGMTYDYGVDTAFDTRIADYAKLLGPPTRRSAHGTPDVDLADVIEWEDSVTHFELRWITRGSGAVSQAVLLDRRLPGK